MHPRRRPSGFPTPTGTLVRLVAAALSLAVLTAACSDSGEGGDGGGGASGGSSTTTAGSASPEETGTGPDSGGTTEATLTPGGEPTPPGGAAAEPARRSDIPEPGRYTYETVVNGKDGEEFLDVIDSGTGDGYVRQLHIRGTNTDATSQAVVWLGNLFYSEAEQRARGGSLTKVCTWDPGLVLMELPLAVGAKWSGESTCADNPGDPVRRRSISVQVTGTETVEVGGTPTEVFVVKQVNTAKVDDDDPPVHIVETRTTTDRISAERHLLVRSNGVLESSLGGVPQGRDTYTKTLVSLKPTVAEG